MAEMVSSPRTPSQERVLTIYLNDHLAAATGGVELARRAAGAERSSPLGPPLRALAEALGDDRDALRSVMGDLDVPVTSYKVYAGWVAEKVGRLKLNGSWVSRSSLSPVVEIEGLRLVVEHQAALWRTLQAQAVGDVRLDSARMDQQVTRWAEHAQVLERLRAQAAASAFGGPLT